MALRIQSLQIQVVQDVQAGVAAEVHHQLTLVFETVDEVEGEGRFGVILDGDFLVVRTTNQFEGELRQELQTGYQVNMVLNVHRNHKAY